MFIKATAFYCISLLFVPAWTKNCSGKLIAKNICIPNEYTNRVSDSFPNPAEVFVDLQRVILLDINPKKKKISLHVDFVMVWFDNRLEWQNYNISDRFGSDDAQNLWIPTYKITGLINLKAYPIAGLGEIVFWVERDNATDTTAIFLYSEFRADVFCKMELEAFPFDKQTCFFEFEDRANQTIIQNNTIKNIEINPTGYSKIKAKGTPTELTNMPVFGIKFELSRNPMAFIVKYHVTSGVLVIIGGISFLIDPKIVPGRMGLLVTLFLVQANFFSNAQNETVSTLNALTIYIISCMLFISAAMIQYGMLLYLSRLRIESKVNTEKSEMDEKWDRKMLVMYVIIFTLFNLIYFTAYLF